MQRARAVLALGMAAVLSAMVVGSASGRSPSAIPVPSPSPAPPTVPVVGPDLQGMAPSPPIGPEPTRTLEVEVGEWGPVSAPL